MTICYSTPTYAKHIVRCAASIGNQMTGQATVGSQSRSKSWCLYFPSGQFRRKCTGVNTSRTFSCSPVDSQAFEGMFFMSGSSKQRSNPFTMKSFFVNSTGRQTISLRLSSRYRNVNLSLSMPKLERNSKTSWAVGPMHWLQGSASAGLGLGLSFFFSSSKPVSAEAPMVKNEEKDDYDSSVVSSSHGKKVYTNYSITGIPGDGRCLFRSVAHGACIRSGEPSPSESLQRELADELRSKVADEFVKRREETEWFIEGDFDTYVSQIRKPHVWGGEPELLMASHVLQMPISVYMRDGNSGGLIAIAEYGQEYGKEDPIRVLYHGFGHYDALQIAGTKGSKSRL